jgi:ribosomal protein S19E (S16A)
VVGHGARTRAQLAAKAGRKAKGSHLRNRLSELRAAGLIEYRSGEIALTPDGNAAAPNSDLGVSLVDLCFGFEY